MFIYKGDLRAWMTRWLTPKRICHSTSSSILLLFIFDLWLILVLANQMWCTCKCDELWSCSLYICSHENFIWILQITRMSFQLYFQLDAWYVQNWWQTRIHAASTYLNKSSRLYISAMISAHTWGCLLINVVVIKYSTVFQVSAYTPQNLSTCVNTAKTFASISKVRPTRLKTITTNHLIHSIT